MRKHTSLAALGLALLAPLMLHTPAAQAGPLADALSGCLVRSSTSDDKLKLVKWMFAAMALHPAVADLALIPDEKRDAANQGMADLLEVLLAERCINQARDAIQGEGPLALQSSFAVLGQVAAMELFSHAEVAAGLANLTEYLSSADLDRKLGIGGN